MLAAMKYPEYPVAVGVIRDVDDENVYDVKVAEQVEQVKANAKIKCVDDLLRSGQTWEIK
jgi:2-oxoglutarate ferredoxin oxidoreductase subunit beta